MSEGEGDQKGKETNAQEGVACGFPCRFEHPRAGRKEQEGSTAADQTYYKREQEEEEDANGAA